MPYKTYVAKINECDAVMPDNFKNSRWANYFTVDSSNVVKNGRANPNHVFDTFGLFSGHTGTEVRVKLLENIASNMPFYERRSAVCLQMRSMSLETWVKTIANELVYCDELGLMGLCYMYHQHCVVLTQNKLWSTVQADKPLNLLDPLNICSVCLIYLGNLRFGVLTWRPRLPKKVATRSPGFNIIEEYTLNEAKCVGLNPLLSTIYGNHLGAIACPPCLDQHWVTPLQGTESHRPTQLKHSHVTCSHWLVMQGVTSYIYHPGTGPGVLWYLVILVSTPLCTGGTVHFR